MTLETYDNRTGYYYASFSVTPSSGTGYTYSWYLGNTPLSSGNANGASCVVYSDQFSNTATLTCRVYSGNTEVGSVSWTLSNTYASDMSVSATVYDTNPGYALGDVPDEGNSGSIVDQINAWIARYGTRNEYIDTIRFTAGTGGELSVSGSNSSRVNGYLTARANTDYSESELASIAFVPTATLSNSSSTATASFNFTVTTATSRNTRGGTYYGTLTFTIKEGVAAGSGIVYAAQIGENITLDSARFQDFWSQNFPSGSLSYVEFTSISGGKLYEGYNGSRGTDVVSSRDPVPCYVNPSSRQTALDGLTVVPSSSNRNTTVTIRFTARGSSRSSGGANSSRSGTVTILYMNSSASITYDAGTNGTVSLNPDDFTSAYRTAVGGNAPSGMTIRFTSLPANGTLSYQSSNTRSVTLTASNMGSYDFTTRTTGSTRISDVSYTAGKNATADTADFVCYSGGTARFAGTITFNSKPAVVENLVVNFSCTSANDTAISAMSFYNSSMAVTNSSYIVLGVPTSGSLYLNGTAMSGSARLSFVTGSGYPLFSGVTYRPAETTANGVVTFPFSAYNANDQLVASGTASINVNLPAPTVPETPTTPTTPTTPSTPSTPGTGLPPVTNPVQLKDVPAGSWYANYVNTLVGAGIIGGYSDGTFRPRNDVTYGEALALIMRAVGYNVQQGVGSNWAMPYLTQAAADGLLPTNAAYGLNDSVNRYTIAEITAKAMGLTPVYGATSSPFADTSDPYVLALHNAGIIGGTGSGYEGDKTFERAEVAAVVYRIYEWKAAQTPGQPETPAQPETPSDTGDDNDSGEREPDRDAPWGY